MNNGRRMLGSALVPAVQVGLRALGLGAYSSLASTIQTLEGWYPGSLSYRLNNPGNLKYAGQAGAVPSSIAGPDGIPFAQFSSYDAGKAALERQIALDASRGLSISAFAKKYAPAEDANNPVSYAAHLASARGLSVDAPLSFAADAGDSALTGGSFLGGSSWVPLSDLFPQSSGNGGGVDPALIAAGVVILGLGILAVV